MVTEVTTETCAPTFRILMFSVGAGTCSLASTTETEATRLSTDALLAEEEFVAWDGFGALPSRTPTMTVTALATVEQIKVARTASPAGSTLRPASDAPG